MTDCPPRLRGDLSKWLCEINTGVYVGQVSGRVRDALWDRVCQNLQNGRATMVYTTNGEQKMDFRVHNTAWTPVDLDGIKLMRRPLPQAAQADEALKPGFSNAAKRQMLQRKNMTQGRSSESYVILDLETTGLDPGRDRILEYGAIKIENGEEKASFSRLVCCDGEVPRQIADLTGITGQLLLEQGTPPKQALKEFLEFIGKEKLIGYNIPFDLEFLRAECSGFGQPVITNRCTDLLSTARRTVYGLENYKLATLAEYFSLPYQTKHRALEDCRLVYQLYYKLKELRGAAHEK